MWDPAQKVLVSRDEQLLASSGTQGNMAIGDSPHNAFMFSNSPGSCSTIQQRSRGVQGRNSYLPMALFP